MGAGAAVLPLLHGWGRDGSEIAEMGRLPPVLAGAGDWGAGFTAEWLESSLRGEISESVKTS